MVLYSLELHFLELLAVKYFYAPQRESIQSPLCLSVCTFLSAKLLYNYKSYQQETLQIDRSYLVEVQCTRTVNLSCLILELLSFVHFYALNFVWHITLKLEKYQQKTLYVDRSHLVKVQCTRTIIMLSLILVLLPFVHFYTLNFVQVTVTDSMKIADLELHIIFLCQIR